MTVCRRYIEPLLSIVLIAAITTCGLAQAPPKTLSVAEAVQLALKESPAIAAAKAESNGAAADVRTAKAMTAPQISANSFTTIGNSPNIITGSPGVSPQAYILAPKRGFADQNLTLMYPLYTGGRLQNEVRAAGKRLQAANSQVSVSQADVALTVKEAYYRVLAAREMEKVAQARVDAGTEMVKNAKEFFEAGKGIEATVKRAEAERADAEKELTAARNDAAKALLDLKTAIGLEATIEIALTDHLGFAPVNGDILTLVKEAAQKRPELLAARAKLEAALAMASAAKGSRIPQVYGLAMADAFDSREMGSGTGGTVGIGVSFPLLDGGQRRAEVSKADAMVDAARAELKTADLRAATEVRQAWLDVQTASANHSTAKTALEAAQSAYDTTVLRVQNQKAIVLEQLDALASLVRAKANLAQALYDHSVAAAKLRRAVGGN